MQPDLPVMQCPQCGLLHPPLQEGQICPMAKQKTDSGEEIELTQFFADLRNILISQIKTKKIKDPKRLMRYILVGTTKLIERYKDKE